MNVRKGGINGDSTEKWREIDFSLVSPRSALSTSCNSASYILVDRLYPDFNDGNKMDEYRQSRKGDY